MSRTRTKKKYNRVIRVGAFVAAALVGVLMGILVGFLLRGHNSSDDHAACVAPTISTEA
jgi:cytochrome bd-type quinol oxidase subunit 2